MAKQLESIVRPNAAVPVTAQTGGATADHQVVDFVCEEDVRQAIRLARKIVIGERTIVTPAARDLAEAHRIFVTAAWPRS
jgi:hypothetical protein